MIGPHRVPRDACVPVSAIVVAAVFNVGLVAVAAVGPRNHAPPPPVVDIDLGTEPTSTSGMWSAVEEPAPPHCVDLDAIRVVRGHVVEMVDHIEVTEDEPAPAVTSRLVLEPNASFVLRFGPGELRRFQARFLDERFHEFAHGMRDESTALCEGSGWIERWQTAWAADSRQLRRFTAIVDSLE
jgi:hypothetical protein